MGTRNSDRAALDATWVSRAIALAAKADHSNSPNPMVGAIVLDAAGQPVGEGFNEKDGSAHAEIVALAQAGERARGGTMYLNLEPCAHLGRTPPCADALIAAGLARVVVSIEDPDRRVAGAGIGRLRSAGVQVDLGIEEVAGRRLNRFYLKHRSTGLPYVTAKFAMSLDGKIATAGGASRWITGDAARAEGHRMREAHDAVLVGVNTVITDDPQLTVRSHDARRQPLRVVVDSGLRIPLAARLLRDQEQASTLVATTAAAGPTAIAAIAATGAELVQLPAAGSPARVDLRALMELLGRRMILSVLAEGGAELNGGLFDAGLVDEVVAFLAPVVIGGAGAPSPVAGRGFATPAAGVHLALSQVARLGDDIVVRGDVHRDH